MTVQGCLRKKPSEFDVLNDSGGDTEIFFSKILKPRGSFSFRGYIMAFQPFRLGVNIMFYGTMYLPLFLK